MGLITKELRVKVNSRTYKYYENLGYVIPRKNNGKLDFSKYITVKVEHLMYGSKIKVEVECDVCHKRYFIAYSHYYKYNHNGKVYCNLCKSKILLSGENNYHWNPNKTDEERLYKRQYPEYTEFVKKVMIRDNYTCQCCGKKSSNDLEVHHLDAYSWCIDRRTDETNGLVLCKICHKAFHDWHYIKFGHENRGNCTKEQYEEWIGHAIDNLEKYGGELPTTRKVYCIDNDIIYDSAEQASKELKIYDKNPIQKVCNRKQHQSNGYHFLWYDEYLKMTKEDVDNYVKECDKLSSKTKIICIETKEVFEKIIDACLKYGTKNQATWISVACKKGRTCMTDENGIPLHWMYYDEYLDAIKNNKEISFHIDNNVTAVICITYGTIFKKIKEACDYYKISKSSIIDCCKGKIKATKLPDKTKTQWMYYEDFLKLPQEEQNEILERNKDSSTDGSFINYKNNKESEENN